MKTPLLLCCIWALLSTASASAQPAYPPSLPGGKDRIAVQSHALLQPLADLNDGVSVAKEPPRVSLMYYPGQDYAGNPWSVWGDGLAVGEVYYSAIGDHLGPRGNAFVYRYDAASGQLTRIVDVQQTINRPSGHYTPGKIHSRIDLGNDGWLYFSTHRGSTRVTTDEHHFKGDWILRHSPETGETEVVAHAPLSKQCLPTSVLDPERLIFYAGSADGDYKQKRVQFLAYDIANKKVLYSDDFGPYRSIIFAPSTGRVYFHRVGGRGQAAKLARFDPGHPGEPQTIDAEVGLRACTIESPDGKVYTVDGDHLWEFNTQDETGRRLGGTAVGREDYIASIDIDPSGWRYLYYVAGAHGGSYRDGSPLVQYDLQLNQKKVICFLHPALTDATGYTCMGTYALAVSPDGAKVYITWNGSQGGDSKGKLRFNTAALTVVEIPKSERPR